MAIFNKVDIMSRGDCESTIPPMILDETVPLVQYGTWDRSADRSYSGTHSYKLLKTYDWTYPTRALFTTSADNGNIHGFTPGKSYEFRARIYVPSGVGVDYLNFVGIEFGQTDNGVSWNIYNEYPNAYDVWQELVMSVTPYSNVTGLYCGVKLGLYNLLNSYIYIDSVQMLGQEGAGLSREAKTIVSPTTPVGAFVLGDILSKSRLGSFLPFWGFEKVMLNSYVNEGKVFNSQITTVKKLFTRLE